MISQGSNLYQQRKPVTRPWSPNKGLCRGREKQSSVQSEQESAKICVRGAPHRRHNHCDRRNVGKSRDSGVPRGQISSFSTFHPSSTSPFSLFLSLCLFSYPLAGLCEFFMALAERCRALHRRWTKDRVFRV